MENLIKSLSGFPDNRNDVLQEQSIRVSFIKKISMEDQLKILRRELRRARKYNLRLMICILLISLGILIYATSF